MQPSRRAKPRKTHSLPAVNQAHCAINQTGWPRIHRRGLARAHSMPPPISGAGSLSAREQTTKRYVGAGSGPALSFNTLCDATLIANGLSGILPKRAAVEGLPRGAAVLDGVDAHFDRGPRFDALQRRRGRRSPFTRGSTPAPARVHQRPTERHGRPAQVGTACRCGSFADTLTTWGVSARRFGFAGA